MGQHDAQCICEICTCGRHQCPFDRAKSHNSSAISFAEEGTGGGGGNHFYRKEFVTVADGMERTKAARPKGELSLEKTPLAIDDANRQHHRQHDNELRPALVADARNERFLTSAALRKRTQHSQIELGEQQQDKATMMRSTYRDEMQQQNGAGGGGAGGRARPVARAPSGHAAAELFNSGGGPETPKSSQHRIDYGAKRAERAQPSRPKTSDLWKREGAIDATTTTREQFAAHKSTGERAMPFRPQENAVAFLGGTEPGADRSFQRESSTLSDYGPKKGERAEARRPPDSEFFRSGEPMLERATVNRSEYGQAGRAERFERRVPAPQGADLLRGDGTFMSETSKSAEFQPKKGDRFEAKIQRSSNIWQHDGTQQPATTVNRSEYRAAKRPDESNILRAEGPFDANSVAREEFAAKGPGERFPTRRPETDEVWRREGTIGEMGSVNRVEYTIEGKRGERFDAHKPQERQLLFDPDIHPSLPLSTVHRTDFVPRQAERAHRVVPTATELLRGDGTFMSETDNSAEFQPKKGDRFEAKIQRSSNIWQNDGKMPNQTVNRDEYGRVTAAERAEARRPLESGILKGEGKFPTETHKRVEFGPKHGERAEAWRPTDSDVFKREGPIGSEGSVNRTEYAHTHGERAERHILAPTLTTSAGVFGATEGAEFAKKTVSQEEFGQKQRDPVHLHRPMQNLRLEGAAPSHGSVTREDFVAKSLEADGQHQPHLQQQRRSNHESSFGLLDNNGTTGEWIARTMTQDEFAPKELDERVRPVVHRSELSFAEPGTTFHTGTMYSDEFQQISPDSYGNRHAIRPSTALKLEGARELTSGYNMEFTNKIVPCPAGELIDSVKGDHVPTKNFEFHSINKGHHLYRSRENLAAAGSEN